MLKIRNYFIVFAVAFAISTAYATIGIQDAKAQAAGSGAAYTDLIKRIEALEANGTGNVTAPDITGIKIGFDVRHRYEQRSQDFASIATPAYADTGRIQRQITTFSPAGTDTSAAGRGRRTDQDFTLQRVRLTLDADVNKNVRGFIMLQDARTFGEEGSTVGNRQRTDIQEAYAELRNLGDLNPILNNLELRVGRWQASYGNDRLIGTLNWANQARSYDGARMKWDNKKNLWVDLFAFQVNETSTGGTDGGGILGVAPSTATTDDVLYGIYSQYKFDGALKGNLIEPYLIVRAQSKDTSTATPVTKAAHEQRYTAGFRLDGKDISGLGGLDYTVEPAWQFGKVEYDPDNIVDGATSGIAINGSAPIQAFAVYAGGGYTFKNVAWTPRIGYAYVFASGDEKKGIGAAKTFDHIYPTGHAQLGYMDVAAWQNIKDHQIHFSIKPTKKLGVDVKGHIFSLDEEADSWYSVAGGIGAGVAGGGGVIREGADTFVDPKTGLTRNVDDDLGQEIDFTVSYNLFKNFGVVAGYSHFFADDFVEDTGAGIDRGSDWAYLQTTLKF